MKTRKRKPDNNSEEVSVGHSTVLFGYAQNLHENGKKSYKITDRSKHFPLQIYTI